MTNANYAGDAESMYPACCPLHAGFLLSLLFSPEDGSDVILQNIGSLSVEYTALYPRK
jgi:hypothetical protein